MSLRPRLIAGLAAAAIALTGFAGAEIAAAAPAHAAAVSHATARPHDNASSSLVVQNDHFDGLRIEHTTASGTRSFTLSQANTWATEQSSGDHLRIATSGGQVVLNADLTGGMGLTHITTCARNVRLYPLDGGGMEIEVLPY